MRVCLVPILKKKGLDSSVKNNYRPIALATIVSKVFELLILERHGDKLTTHYGQFGYKKGVGTETAVFTLRQVAHYYLRKNSSVYLCYLDASKAFDNVRHDLLLEKLCTRGIDNETIGFLSYWFNNQYFVCRWKNFLSSPFPVRQGVRQGGINSALYFAVYMDNLCVSLEKSDLGCNVGSVKCNYIAYADDYCLLASSVAALQQLINICVHYANEHNIMFNATKTFCQAFIPREMAKFPPTIKIMNKNVEWVDNVRYLGYDICCWERDKTELVRRKRELYSQANLAASRFRNSRLDIKKYIFKTFFSNMYCMSLWCPTEPSMLRSVQVAYNDAFRILFGFSRRSSASMMFAQHEILDFKGIRRRAVISLLTRLCKSSNPVLSGLFNSRMLLDSSLYQSWRILLLSTLNENDYDLYHAVCNYSQI